MTGTPTALLLDTDILIDYLRDRPEAVAYTEIAVRGGLVRRDFGKSHGTGLADALIAATALVHQLRLVGLNRKHFPMLPDMLTPY
jgi:predicted nucleic acid-binding protein